VRALLLVDIQNDFLPGGALAARRGDEVIPVANRLAARFERLVATQDWHPPDHGSFAVNQPGHEPGDVIDLGGLAQVLWPVHCVQGSEGARLADALDRSRIERVFRKGTEPGIDSYSGFFDNGHRKATGLGEHLRAQGVTDLYLVGIATDYCVKYTALDARQLGFRTVVVEDGCRGVEREPGDVDRALAEMRAAGVEVVQSGNVLAALDGA
jgi:nicotinamidase/pyrazinamidase